MLVGKHVTQVVKWLRKKLALHATSETFFFFQEILCVFKVKTILYLGLKKI